MASKHTTDGRLTHLERLRVEAAREHLGGLDAAAQHFGVDQRTLLRALAGEPILGLSRRAILAGLGRLDTDGGDHAA